MNSRRIVHSAERGRQQGLMPHLIEDGQHFGGEIHQLSEKNEVQGAGGLGQIFLAILPGSQIVRNGVYLPGKFNQTADWQSRH